jgi:hypothetical protein
MSKKYTPTTEEVRAVYASGVFTQTGPTSYNIDEENSTKEFNRWLNEEKSKAWREGNDAGLDDESLVDPYKKKKND